MTGPSNAAIGADYDSVYQKMRFNKTSRFEVSTNKPQFNAVIIELNDNNANKITRINLV
jgi:calcineurin-like phosphoesterase